MLKLDPMTQPEYEAYIATGVDEFAHESARAWKRPVGEFTETAHKDFAEMLPQGLHTPDNFLFTVRKEGEVVGLAWLAMKQSPSAITGSIFDIQLREAWRGKGLGRELLGALEDIARQKGATRMALNVFGNNPVARALYESAGFEAARIAMFKVL